MKKKKSKYTKVIYFKLEMNLNCIIYIVIKKNRKKRRKDFVS